MSLTTQNWLAFALHVTLAVVATALFVSYDRAAFKYPIYGGTVEEDSSVGGFGYRTNLKVLGKVWVPGLVIAFFAVTAIAHAAYAMDWGGFYSKAVAAGHNRWRWLEYGISATIMIVLIGILSRVNEVGAVSLMAVAIIGTMLAGDIAEGSLKSGPWLTATATGWLLTTAALGVIIGNFMSTIQQARKHDAEIPDWVHWVIWPEALMFMSFGFVALAQRLRPNVAYTTWETSYISLSFVAKAFLGIWAMVGLINQTDPN